MQINIFSGGRRIALVVGFIIACLAALFAFLINGTHAPTTLIYAIEMKQPIKRATGCSYNDDSERTSIGTVYGLFDVDVIFCFRSITLKGEQYIPYLDSSGAWLAGRSYSDEVSNYERGFIKQFEIPETDRAEATADSRDNAHWVFLYSVLAFTGTAVTVWIVTCILGWIVRGFLSVPRGEDFRPPQQ